MNEQRYFDVSHKTKIHEKLCEILRDGSYGSDEQLSLHSSPEDKILVDLTHDGLCDVIESVIEPVIEPEAKEDL